MLKILPVFLLLFLTVIFFFKGISSKYVFFSYDNLGFYIPVRDYIFKLLKEGTLPLWCDKMGIGFPLVAEGHTALFYPLNLVYLLFSIAFATNFILIFHYFLCAYFTFLYCRTIKLDNFSSIISSLTFAFGGYLTGHSLHLNIVTTVSWFPLVLLFVEKGFKDNKYFVFAGIIMGVQTLAYFPQISLYTACAILLYFIIRKIFFKDIKFRVLLKGIFVILIIAAVISSVQIIPTYELVKNSIRAHGVDYERFFRDSFSLSYLPYVFFPEYQNIFFPNFQLKMKNGIYNWGMCEFFIYVGTVPLVLLFIAFFKKNKYIILFSLLLIFSFLYSLGKNFFFNKLFFYLPPFNFFGSPARILFLVSFSISVIIGFGFNKLKISNILKILVILLIILDLFIFNVKKNIFYDTLEKYLPSKQTISFLKKDKSNYRVLGGSFSVEIAPNLNLYYGISNVDIFTPLLLDRYKNFMSKLLEKDIKKFLDLLNVKYVITEEGIYHPELELVFQDEDTIKIYKNKNATDTFAFTVYKYKKVKNKNEAMKILLDRNFNFTDTVIVEGNILPTKGNKKFLYNRFNVFKRYGFSVFMKEDGFLVFSQSFYPGWSVYVNGTKSEIYPANYAMQAVYLDKGYHLVDFVYEPMSFKIGWILSIFSVIIVMIILVKGVRSYGRRKSISS